MAAQYGVTPEINAHWKKITDKVVECVLENSPSDETLAQYLGSYVKTDYEVLVL